MEGSIVQETAAGRSPSPSFDVVSLPTTAYPEDGFVVIDPEEAMLPREKVDDIRRWLAPTDFLSDSGEFKRHLKAQAPGTGLWLCKTDRFRDWSSSATRSCLWIKGVPGAGKSVIAASLVDHFATQEPSVPVLFFFFRNIVDANRRPRSLLRDWLAQLLPHSASLQHTLSGLAEAQPGAVPDQVLWECLYKALSTVSRAICIVDALDEMDEADGAAASAAAEFYQHINGLARLRPQSVKLFLTSRPRQEIQSHLPAAAVVHISLEQERVDHDILAFVSHRVREARPDMECQDLIKAITTRCSGLFLYARLLVDQITPLLQQSLPVDVDALPQGLENLYAGMLSQQAAELDTTEDVQAFILGFVTHSSRPLRLRELGCLVIAHLESDMTPAEAKVFVKRACGPLLEVLHDETVQILHHSLTEFLLDRNKRASFPTLDPAAVHKNLACICMQTLSLWDPESRDPDGRPLDYAMQAWAYHAGRDRNVADAEFWDVVTEFCERMKKIGEEEDDERPGSRTSNRPARPTSHGYRCLYIGALRFAAYLGLIPYLRHLISKGLPTHGNSEPRTNGNGSDDPALLWACRGGHLDAVKLLLSLPVTDDKASPEAESYAAWKAYMIEAAVISRHVPVVKCLLDAGFEALPRGWNFAELPATFINMECLSVILPHAAEDRVPMLLCQYAENGDPAAVRLILADSRSSPNATLAGVTALFYACLGYRDLSPTRDSRDSVECVRLLLEAGADSSALSTFKPDPLGARPTDRLILVKGSTPLHGLAKRWTDKTHHICQAIFAMLVAVGADINARDAEGNTPLAYMFLSRLFRSEPRKTCHQSVAHLLSQGADACARNDHGQSILRLMLQSYADPELARLLLSHGADASDHETAISSTVPLFDNILHNADERLSPSRQTAETYEVVRLLAEHGASLDFDPEGNAARNAMTDGDGELLGIYLGTCTNKTILGTVLIDALKWVKTVRVDQATADDTGKKIEIFKMVIEAGASIEERDEDGLTPLLWAARVADRDLFGLFLGRGADRNAVDKDGNGVLHHCVRGLDESNQENFEKLPETLDYFVSLGFDPLKANNLGENLLHLVVCSIWNGDSSFNRLDEDWKQCLVTIEQLLLKYGVSPRGKTDRGLDALHYIVAEEPVDTTRAFDFTSSARMLYRFIRLCQSTEEGIDLESRDGEGLTPLQAAASTPWEDSAQLVDVLLSAGADRLARGSIRATALHIACGERNASVVSLLLARDDGTLCAQRDNKGRTPLFIACESAVPEIVAMLIQAGADVNARDNRGLVPLHACTSSEQRHQDMVLRRPGLFAQHSMATNEEKVFSARYPESSISFATFAVQNIDEFIASVVRQLLDHGADPSLSGPGIPSPAVCAWNRSCRGMMSALTERGLAPDGCDVQAQWALMQRPGLLSQDLHPSVMEEILFRPERYLSHMVAEDMDWLIQRNANLRSIIYSRRNADYLAATRVSCLQRIVLFGLTTFMERLSSLAKDYDSPDRKVDSWDVTATSKLKHEDMRASPTWTIQDLATKHRLLIRPLVYEACRRKAPNLQMIKSLVEVCKVDVNARVIYLLHPEAAPATTPLYRGHHDTMEHQDAGADTALGFIALRQDHWHLQALRYLVSRGADVNIRDRSDKTPLMLACSPFLDRVVPWTLEFVTLLLELGADPNLEDSTGRTCLDFAGNLDVVELLVAKGADFESRREALLRKGIRTLDPDLTRKSLLGSSIDLNTMRDSSEHGTVDPRHRIIHMLPITSSYERIRDSNLPLVGALFLLPLSDRVPGTSPNFGPADSVESRQKRKAIVTMLLEHGANPLVVLQNGHTLLHSVVRHALVDDDLLDILTSGITGKFNAADSDGLTLFHVACAFDSPDLIDQHRIQVDPSTTNREATARQGATRHLKMISAGADITATSTKDENALHMMLSSPWMPTDHILDFLQRPPITRLALNKTTRGHSPLHYALFMLRPEVCEALLRLGGDATLVFPDDQSSPLHHIAWQCLDPDIVYRNLSDRRDAPADLVGIPRNADHTEACLKLWRQFLAAGNDVNARDKKGLPPLFWYLQSRGPEYNWATMIDPIPDDDDAGSTLTSSTDERTETEEPQEPEIITNFKAFFGDADLQARDLSGKTALHVVACLPHMRNDVATFQYLLEQGLDPLVEDDDGNSSLDIAATTGKRGILSLFQSRGGHVTRA